MPKLRRARFGRPLDFLRRWGPSWEECWWPKRITGIRSRQRDGGEEGRGGEDSQ